MTEYDIAEANWLADFLFERERWPRDDEREKFHNDWWNKFEEEQKIAAAELRYEEMR